MKRLFIIMSALLMAGMAQAQFKGKDTPALDGNEWNNREVTSYNRLDARSNIVAYADENAIEKLDYENSPLYVSLNGTWKMNLDKGVNSIGKDLDVKTFSADGWQNVTLPASQWSKDGKALAMPKITSPNELPQTSNYVASYYKEFEVTKSWADYSAILRLQARSAFYVWVNNQYVGYAEDSRSLSEFDITDYLKYGKKNNLIIQVVGVSDGSLLEMNQPRTTNGITGNVAIVLEPTAYVLDYDINNDYSYQNGVGNFALNLRLANKTGKGKYYVEVELWDPAGKEVEKVGKWMVFDKRTEVKHKFESEVLDAKPWTNETPSLYTVVVRVRDEKMNIIETVGSRFGFRHLEMQDGVLTLNGTPMALRGVVYNNMYKDGSELTREQIKKDLVLMKQHNVNAVRTRLSSPAADYLYELCDSYGIYVICDANLMPYSGQSKAVVSDNEFSDMMVERVARMYDHYKNYTSIIAWSLGDGTGNGVCMENAYKALKSRDKNRAVIYAGAGYSENTDIIGEHSTDIDMMKQSLAKQSTRPMILMGYQGSKGNGFGGLEPVWQLIRSNRRMQGGFLENWNDVSYYDMASERDAFDKGIVNTDGAISPILNELKELYREFDVKIVNVSPDHYEFNVTNFSNASSLNDYRVEYNIYSNLKPRIIEGDVSMSLEPGESKNFKLKVPKLTLYAGEDLYIKFTTKQRKDSELVPKGTVLSNITFPLPMYSKSRQAMPDYDKRPLTMTALPAENPQYVVFSNDSSDFEVKYNLEQAEIEGYSIKGQQLLQSPLKMNFWREPTDNDQIDKNAYRIWQNLKNMSREVIDANYRMIDRYTASIDVMMRYFDNNGATMCDVKQTIQILCSGDVIVNNEIVASELVKGLPKVGMQFALTSSLDTVDWYGMQDETYIDRCQSGIMSINSRPLAQMTYDYGHGQESGNRTQVGWSAVRNGQYGMYVDMLDTLYNFSVQPSQNVTTVNVDYRMAGIGNAVSGSPIAEKYLIKDKKFKFRVHLRPYLCDDNDARDFSMIAYPEAESGVLPMPVITKNKERFNAPMEVTMKTSAANAEIRYTLDGTTPTEKSPLYKKPITINASTVVKARTYRKGATTSFTTTQVYNYDYISSITYANKPSTPYNYKSESVLFDGETGSVNNLSQGWLGFSGSDFSAVLELSKAIDLDQVVLRFAHVPETWVFAPTAVDVYTSADGVNFDKHYEATIPYDPSAKEMNSTQLQTVKVDVEQAGVKYVKIVAKNLGKTPKWHKAKGLPAWIMIDEIKLNEVIK